MKKILLPFIFLLSGLISCQQESVSKIDANPLQSAASDSNFVNMDLAIDIADVQMKSSMAKNAKTSVGKVKTLKSSFAVKPAEALSSCYILNYEGGGFAIVSADKRLNPILAFSDEGAFPTDLPSYPSAIVAWLSRVDFQVENARRNNEKQTAIAKAAWDSYEQSKSLPNGRTFADDDNSNVVDPRCSSNGQLIFDQTTTVGPLVQTKWGQGVGYNDQLTYAGCTAYSNGRPPTGCVATAVAGIMRSRQYPSSYNWSAMNNLSGSSETARLMKDIGSSVGMNYACDKSGAEVADAATALVNTFGYASATYASYNQSTVRTDIKNSNRAVILRGGSIGKWWIFNVYDDGHAWICDGTMEDFYKMCAPIPGKTGFKSVAYSSTLKLHMNWGWAGTSGANLDGWFDYGNFNPGESTFNYQVHQITNITKP